MVPNRVVLVGLLVAIAACTSVRRVQPVTYLENHAPRVVWVTYSDNTVVLVAEPEVRRDTLRGTLQGTRVKIPLVQIQTVEAKVRDHTRTALLLGALGVAAVGAVYAAFISQAGSPGGNVVYCPVDNRGRATQYC